MKINMNAGQFSKNILDLNENILFAGVLEKSGHLSSSYERVPMDGYLKGRNLEMVYSQSVYVADLRKMLSNTFGNLNSICYIYEKLKILLFPIKDHILLVFVNKEFKIDDLTKNIYEYIKTQDSLDLYSV
ncbi:MAG: hypothetical protein ACTHME_08760 [Candidatus Nitrosocosmicus sp.]|jgi:hypothetical protein